MACMAKLKVMNSTIGFSPPIAAPTHSAALAKAGYSRTKKTFFIWEGVSMYLTEQQVRDFLHDIATHALPGSDITFDHFNPFFNPPANEANAKLVAMLKEWGEPWIFGIPCLLNSSRI